MSKNKKKINKKLIFLISFLMIIFAIILCIIFRKKATNSGKIGNNSSSQEIVDYILNISSYEATIEVEVQSNKNSNKYILKQTYEAPNKMIQEVIEPSNIQGVKLIKEENTLKLENIQLNLTKIFQGYEYMTDNSLDLNTFIDEYKNLEEVKCEEDNEIILEIENAGTNKYSKYKKLYIDKNTAKPTKMEIRDENNKTIIYILYNEININS